MHHIFSNWMSGFKPRVRPDFLRGFYVPGYKLIKVISIRPNIANNAYTSKNNTLTKRI